MKNSILVIFALLFAVPAFADQLAWLTKEQADQTMEWLKSHPIDEVVLWCACCDGDAKTYTRVEKYEMRKVEGETAFYELVITTKNAQGKRNTMAVDLAYVHIRKGNKYHCLGKAIGLECDPCTKPFKWQKEKLKRKN